MEIELNDVLIVIGIITIGTVLRLVFKDSRFLTGGVVVAGLYLFIKSPDLRNMLVALAAVLGLFVATYSMEQTTKLRKDSLDKEERDRKAKLLDEVLLWGEKVGRCPIETNSQDATAARILEGTASSIEARNFFEAHKAGFQRAYKEARWQNAYILNISNSFGESLSKSVDLLINQLKEHEDMILRFKSAEPIPPQVQQIAAHNRTLEMQLEKVLMELSLAKVTIRPPIK